VSKSGRRALQGFTYQAYVALDWLVEMIYHDRDDPIDVISIDSVGLLDAERMPKVDDIVIRFESGKTLYVQAKKGQTDRKSWSLADTTLQKEVRNARDQVEDDEEGRVRFYSRDQFGDVHKLAEDCRTQYPSYDVFETKAPDTLSGPIKKLADLLNYTEKQTFELIQRIEFEVTYGFEGWERDLIRRLKMAVSDPKSALSALSHLLRKPTTDQTSAPRHEISRDHVVEALEEVGVRVTPDRSIEEILDAFDSASQFGRSWKRTIDGEQIPREEVDEIIEQIRNGEDQILVKGKPGSGKTCVLLDLVDRIEADSNLERLFIKGDRFSDICSISDLASEGLPQDIPGQCARLAQEREVVVILDALDVLSLNRHHDALEVFLGLIEQLSPLPNVTTVAACRTFDLDYDPQLRGVEWDESIMVDPLGFDDQVAPFLEKWSVDPSTVSENLRDELRIPQNLDLYAKIAKKGRVHGVQSVYQLRERFLQELVVKDGTLGEEALEALQEMATNLVDNRSRSIARAAFDGSETVIQRLVSQEVLSEPTNGQLSFAHQTLGDNLAIRQPLEQGKTLQQFIRDHPPLPFIRPSVRSFFFYLRANQPHQFRRQVWTVLDDDDIAYHLRRLIVESLSELQPTEQDWPLLRRLFNQHEDLFRRFFDRIQGQDWIAFLRENWLPLILEDASNDSWPLRFVQKLGVLCPEHTEVAVRLWERALNERWADQPEVAGTVLQALNRDKCLNDVEVVSEAFIHQLIDHIDPDRPGFDYQLGPLVARWIEGTDKGDELLWSYIAADVEDEDLETSFLYFDAELHLHFHQDHFLKDRLTTSDKFISIAIDALAEWSRQPTHSDTENAFRRTFLNHTSWEAERSAPMVQRPQDIGLLLRSLEMALSERCRQNDSWWQENEPRLRTSQDLALRYLTIKAYSENPEDNLEGIREQICDTDLHLHSGFQYEIGQLMQVVYPLLSRSVRRQNQTSILALRDILRDEEGTLSTRRARTICDYLNWIPRCFHEPATRDFLNKWESAIGVFRSTPKIRSGGGAVHPPVSAKQLLCLSPTSLVQLLDFFQGLQSSLNSEGDMVGGQEMLQRALVDASSLDPARFIEHLSFFRASNVDAGYIQSICRGVAQHTRYRFGNLNQDEDWNPIRPLPSLEFLAQNLLRMVETYAELWEDEHAVKRAINAASETAEYLEYADRLIIPIFQVLSSQYESPRTIDSEQSAQSAALNHPHGVAAGSAVILWQQMHSREESKPKLMDPLLGWCARHPNLAARAALLHRLPYLVQENPDLGWHLFDLILDDAPEFFWPIAEQTLYYNYHDDFTRVEKHLDRIENKALDEAGETYGRIMTLSHLSGHVSQEVLFDKLETANESVRKGAAQVFGSNLDRQPDTCISGATRLLQFSELSEDTWGAFISKSLHGDKFQQVPKELVETIIRTLPAQRSRGHFYEIADWIAQRSKTNPRGALDVMETLVRSIEERDHSRFIPNSDVIAEAVLSILREADEYGEEELVRRALSLQDRLLKLGFTAVDRMLDEASREW